MDLKAFHIPSHWEIRVQVGEIGSIGSESKAKGGNSKYPGTVYI